MDKQQAALLGAIEMLHKISKGETFRAIEFHARMQGYKMVLLDSLPELKDDAYFGPLFNGVPVKA